MKGINKRFWIFLSVLAFSVLSCSLVTGSAADPTEDPSIALFTAAALTVEARLTQAEQDKPLPTDTIPPTLPPVQSAALPGR